MLLHQNCKRIAQAPGARQGKGVATWTSPYHTRELTIQIPTTPGLTRSWKAHTVTSEVQGQVNTTRQTRRHALRIP